MRELDLILQGYLERHADDLDDTSRATFEALLAVPDPELYGWLTGRDAPADAALRRLVDELRATRPA